MLKIALPPTDTVGYIYPMDKSPPSPEVQALLDRIYSRLDATGKSERAAAEEAGLSGSTIRNMREGKVASPRLDTIRKLAGVLDTSAEWLAFGTEAVGSFGWNPGKQPIRTETGASELHTPRIEALQPKLVTIPVVGAVEAGAFREAPEYEPDDRRFLAEPADREFPQARLIAFDVSGDSMNDLRPRPILDKDIVVGIDFHDIDNQIILRDGMVVVVEQTRDGGHTREWSVKQLEIHEDRYEFCPRSTNKRHKPIVVEKKVFHDPSEDDGRMVRLLALVRRISTDINF